MFFKMLIRPIILSFTGIIFSTSHYIDRKEYNSVSKEKSLAVAADFLLECPTFKFDGIRDSVKLSIIDVLPQLHCWKFTFVFICKQSGYGNRNGQQLLQIPEQHRITITVESGRITDATIDDIWDEIQQHSL